MTKSRWFAWACALSVVACGSGGGGTIDTSEFGPEDPDFNDDQATDSFGSPPLSYGEAPNNTEQPAPNPNQPTGPTSGGEVPTGTCSDICAGLLAGGCAFGTREVCTSQCDSGLAEFGQCADELITLYMCIINDPSFMCVDGEFEAEAFAQVCQNEGNAFGLCLDQDEPGPSPEPEPEPNPEPTNMCSLEQGCMCGDDLCATCLCAFGNDTASCVDYCG